MLPISCVFQHKSQYYIKTSNTGALLIAKNDTYTGVLQHKFIIPDGEKILVLKDVDWTVFSINNQDQWISHQIQQLNQNNEFSSTSNIKIDDVQYILPLKNKSVKQADNIKNSNDNNNNKNTNIYQTNVSNQYQKYMNTFINTSDYPKSINFKLFVSSTLANQYKCVSCHNIPIKVVHCEEYHIYCLPCLASLINSNQKCVAGGHVLRSINENGTAIETLTQQLKVICPNNIFKKDISQYDNNINNINNNNNNNNTDSNNNSQCILMLDGEDFIPTRMQIEGSNILDKIDEKEHGNNNNNNDEYIILKHCNWIGKLCNVHLHLKECNFKKHDCPLHNIGMCNHTNVTKKELKTHIMSHDTQLQHFTTMVNMVNNLNNKLNAMQNELQVMKNKNRQLTQSRTKHIKQTSIKKTFIHKNGNLFFQKTCKSKEQMKQIALRYDIKNNNIWMFNKRKYPLHLFADNIIDKNRSNLLRKYTFGQSWALKDYDRSFCFGISASYTNYDGRCLTPLFSDFKITIDKEFSQYEVHLKKGFDIIIPYLTFYNLNGDEKMQYMEVDNHGNWTQVLEHTLGTGVYSLPSGHLRYIQEKIEVLKKIANSFTYGDRYLLENA